MIERNAASRAALEAMLSGPDDRLADTENIDRGSSVWPSIR